MVLYKVNIHYNPLPKYKALNYKIEFIKTNIFQ